ncbi:hypothetical protein [Flavobacterium sp. MDT1-60]|uniref:hypothetical protein n=1 Tax=Flavobacterium sp. MDT1-60 TaxID=1979344 RepID=UPI0017833900|nr:hypothetical protein [Flavobacterium sp. MDT1-60]QOG02249.1 hypothetical protein IHE43_21100 [Flavobacterium sp. MDT1-60]
MNAIKAFLLLILVSSCQITETIKINPDGSGSIEVFQLRDENSYMQLGRPLSSSEKFTDTIFVFQDYITKYTATFVKFNKSDQALFQEHANVKMHVKLDPIQMENFNVISSDFKKIEELPNVYESLSLANSLKENYPVSKESFKIKYTFDGSVFKRYLVIVDQQKFDQDKKMFEERKKTYSKYKLAQSYTLKYHFPGKIKSISNEKAIISPDKKSFTLEFQLSDCLQNPKITNLEVVLQLNSN